MRQAERGTKMENFECSNGASSYDLHPTNGADWYPASGYMTKSKRPKWRVVRGHRNFVELKVKSGNVWLCDSYEAALRKARVLNRK